MKLGVCSNFRQAETVKNLGYDYIEEHFYRLSIYTEEEFEEAKKAYKKAGIKVYSTNCFFGPGVNLYGDDVYKFLDGYVDRTAKRASELGVKLCVFGSGGARKVPEGMTYEEAEQKLIKVINYCADICGKYGMKLAIEPLQRVETNMIISVKEACEFARKANNDNVGAIVDFHHFYINGESDDGLKGCADKLFHAHIARPNPDRRIPLQEDVKIIKKWKQMLEDIGYDKTLSLECIFGENWADEYEQAKPILEIFNQQKNNLLNKNTKLKVTEYEVLENLPDLFTFNDGREVKTKEDWEERRKELYQSAVVLQYGDLPEPEFLEVETCYMSPKKNTYRIYTGKRAHPISFTMTLIHPQVIKHPVIVDGDYCFGYALDKEYLSKAIDKGIAWAFFDRTELAHDIVGEGKRKGQLYDCYPEYQFGAIRAWAWGYSRVVDALEKIKEIEIEDNLIAFSGHSRGAKTAALAGVLDKRAVVVNPNETCAGSCGCYRIHMKGINSLGNEFRSETLKDLVTAFDFWMNPELANYKEDETKLPFDAHFIKALVAPRTLFISEAVHDIWANPIGSYQTTMAAKEAYKLLGAEDKLLWYFRDGEHCHTPLDVEMLVNVMLNVKNGTPLNENFFRRPFDEYPPIYRKL